MIKKYRKLFARQRNLIVNLNKQYVTIIKFSNIDRIRFVRDEKSICEKEGVEKICEKFKKA